MGGYFKRVPSSYQPSRNTSAPPRCSAEPTVRRSQRAAAHTRGPSPRAHAALLRRINGSPHRNVRRRTHADPARARLRARHARTSPPNANRADLARARAARARAPARRVTRSPARRSKAERGQHARLAGTSGRIFARRAHVPRASGAARDQPRDGHGALRRRAPCARRARRAGGRDPVAGRGTARAARHGP